MQLANQQNKVPPSTVPPPSASGSLDLNNLAHGTPSSGIATYEPPASRHDDGYSERRRPPEDACTHLLKPKLDIVLTAFMQTARIGTGRIDTLRLIAHSNMTNHIHLLGMRTEAGIMIGTETEKFDGTEIVTMIEEMSDDKIASGKGPPALVRDEHILPLRVIMKIK